MQPLTRRRSCRSNHGCDRGDCSDQHHIKTRNADGRPGRMLGFVRSKPCVCSARAAPCPAWRRDPSRRCRSRANHCRAAKAGPSGSVRGPASGLTQNRSASHVSTLALALDGHRISYIAYRGLGAAAGLWRSAALRQRSGTCKAMAGCGSMGPAGTRTPFRSFGAARKRPMFVVPLFLVEVRCLDAAGVACPTFASADSLKSGWRMSDRNQTGNLNLRVLPALRRS